MIRMASRQKIPKGSLRSQGPEEIRVNKWITFSPWKINVHTCRLARLISPVGSLWIYCKGFLCFVTDPHRLCCSVFWKSITASYILVGGQQVVRRVTEDGRRKGDRSAKWQVKKRIREDTCATWLSSLWSAFLGDGSEWDRKRKSNRALLIRELKHQLRIGREF